MDEEKEDDFEETFPPKAGKKLPSDDSLDDAEFGEDALVGGEESDEISLDDAIDEEDKEAMDGDSYDDVDEW